MRLTVSLQFRVVACGQHFLCLSCRGHCFTLISFPELNKDNSVTIYNGYIHYLHSMRMHFIALDHDVSCM